MIMCRLDCSLCRPLSVRAWLARRRQRRQLRNLYEQALIRWAAGLRETR